MITKQAGFALKYERQKELADYSDKYELHCGGACAHYGKIPKGCAGCLFQNVSGRGSFLGREFNLPNVCNANCKHCFCKLGDKFGERQCNPKYELPNGWQYNVDKCLGVDDHMNTKSEIIKILSNSNPISIISFSGDGAEPLLYLPVIERVVTYYKVNIEPHVDKDIVYKLYTNGKLLTKNIINKLVKMGVNEVRINSSAFKFSDEITNHVKMACEAFPVVTSELGVFPQYYDDIYRLMPEWDDMGLTHLTLCQPKYNDMDVLKSNTGMFPDNTVCYPASNDWVMVDDGGETEKIIKYAIDNEFSFSVLDCNCFVMNQESSDGALAKQLNDMDFEKVIDGY